jgi:DNA-directed RNA polymerase subunit E'/Rpb7
MDNIYFENLIVKKVIVEPKFLTTQIDEYILKTLQKKYEGKCVHEGYIKEDTIEIVKKSAGILYGSHFTGEITYNVLFKAQICNPVCGNEIEFEVSNFNAMCVSGTLGPIQIIVPKELHDSDELKILNSVKQGDRIKIEVIKSRYFPYGSEIRVIGKIVSKTQNVKNSGNKNSVGNKNTFVTTLDDDEMSVQEVETNNIGIQEGESDEESSDDESGVEDEESDEEIELSDTESEGEPNVDFNIKDPTKETQEEEEEKEDEYQENLDEVISDDEGDETYED